MAWSRARWTTLDLFSTKSASDRCSELTKSPSLCCSWCLEALRPKTWVLCPWVWNFANHYFDQYYCLLIFIGLNNYSFSGWKGQESAWSKLDLSFLAKAQYCVRQRWELQYPTQWRSLARIWWCQIESHCQSTGIGRGGANSWWYFWLSSNQKILALLLAKSYFYGFQRTLK